MAGPRVTPTQTGMMYGMIAGAGIGAVMFALSGDVLWIVLAGVGVALGLGIGATVEQSRRRRDADGRIAEDGHRDDAGADDGQRSDPSGGTGAAR
ncbi:hypothetical protein ACQE98_01925 [Ornithinimicrobium sp. W1679]|uniref:hypothetical protein n=1 Tax=unclassified Ornithinimicrobium TaxID=2615080 RepID=UPI003CF61490